MKILFRRLVAIYQSSSWAYLHSNSICFTPIECMHNASASCGRNVSLMDAFESSIRLFWAEKSITHETKNQLNLSTASSSVHCSTGVQTKEHQRSLNQSNSFLRTSPNDLLKLLPLTLSPDWKSKDLAIPVDADIWNNLNLSGRREGPLFAEEPNFVMLRNDGDLAQRLGKHETRIWHTFSLFQFAYELDELI